MHGPDWTNIAGRLDELRAVLPELADLPDATPENAPTLLARLASGIEDLRRRSIRDQIQLVSMQEMTESLLRERDPDRVLERLAGYLRQVLDLEDVLLLRRRPRPDVWTAFYASWADELPRRIGRVPWQPQWIDLAVARSAWPEKVAFTPPPDGAVPGPWPPGAGGSEASATGRPEPADPHRYALVLLLGSVSIPDRPLGILCLNPGAGLLEPWNPAEIAHRIEGILEALWFREEMESEARFRHQLLESMGDGVLAVDPDGIVLELNEAAGKMLALTPSATVGRGVEALHESAPALRTWLRKALVRGKPPGPREFALRPGQEVPVNVSVCGLRDEEGGFAGFVVNLTDLTSLRAMEQEIRRLDRLAALGRFAAGVAHEIRNPLAGIGAGVEFLSGRFGSDSPEQEDLRFLRTEIRRLDRIVSDMLDYTRPRPLDRQPCEAGALVSRVRQSLAPLLGSRTVELACEGPERLVLFADADRLEQVLLNLVKNAVEASPDGSAVHVRWDARPDHRVRFRVEDRGPGMSAEERSRAFEPFFTTKGNGTGLGLSLSHAIVEQHGGRLLLESTAGRGTVAVLELPGIRPERWESDAVVHSDR